MDKNNDVIRALYAAILKLLRPLVQLSLKNGVSYKTFASLVKWAFYDVAKNEFIIEGRKQSISRVAVLTGFSRKEVKRLSETTPPANRSRDEQYNRGARVISGWRREKSYLDRHGRPKPIPISGGKGSFEKLVKRYSGDMPTRAVLDELSRIGAIEVDPKKRVRLVSDAFIPTVQEATKLKILGTDVELLISTIAYNIDPDTPQPFFQRKVYYDNLPQEVLADLRRMSGLSAQKLLDNLDRYFAINDRDVNPELKGTGRNVAGIGVYYFEKPFEEDE